MALTFSGSQLVSNRLRLFCLPRPAPCIPGQPEARNL